MNEHDLLEAFQCVDPEFLEEAAARVQSAPPKKTTRQVAASLLEKKDDDMSDNKLWQGLMGAAAMIAVCSIMAVGVATVMPNSEMTATQPVDSAVTEISADMTDTEAAEEAETTTETTDLQPPRMSLWRRHCRRRRKNRLYPRRFWRIKRIGMR